MANGLIDRNFPQHGRSTAFMWTRLLIIMLIALGHISTLPKGPGTPEILFHFGYDPSWLGVNVLFMLTGFMAMRSLMRRKSTFKLLKTRALRILPILLIYVLAVIFIVFPLFGIHPNEVENLPKYLSLYAFDVITCLNPGRELPGLFDNALYACIIQGAIWTFRWGLLAFIGAAIGWKLGLFKSKAITATLAAAALMTYAIAHGLHVNQLAEIPSASSTGLRLGWPFLVGMAAYHLQDRLPRDLGILFGLFVFTAIQYFFGPWTPFIEIGATLMWGYIAYLLITSELRFPKFMTHIPDFAIALYIFHWPVSMIILHALPDIGANAFIVAALPITVLVSVAITLGWQVGSRLLSPKANDDTSLEKMVAE